LNGVPITFERQLATIPLLNITVKGHQWLRHAGEEVVADVVVVVLIGD
jgi:hypothetical protein